MQPSIQSATPALTPSGVDLPRTPRSEGISYQVVTIGAILLVLVSMWVF